MCVHTRTTGNFFVECGRVLSSSVLQRRTWTKEGDRTGATSKSNVHRAGIIGKQ